MQNVSSNLGILPLDISLGDVAVGTGYARHALGLGNGKVSAGMQKLADRFIVTLFNILGTTKHDATFGTELIPGIAVGSSMNFGVLQSNIAVAVSEAELQIQADDENEVYTDVLPDTEKLASAVCDEVEYDVKAGAIRLYVSLTSEAGESYTYILPANLAFMA